MDELCCEAMARLVQRAGDPGLSVVWSPRPDGPAAFLQARACAAEHTERLDALLADQPPEVRARGFPVRLAEQLPIQSCPFCAASLAEWAARHPVVAEGLAEELGHLDLEPKG